MITPQKSLPSGSWLASALLVCLWCSGCGRGSGAAPPSDQEERDGAGASPGAVAEPEPVLNQVAYDAQGIPLPHPHLRALGVALPRGFERLQNDPSAVVYGGRIPAPKLVAFYHQYVDCSHVTQGKRGWFFRDAVPRAPGDRSRKLDLTILQRGPRHSSVVVVDRTAGHQGPLPDGGPTYFEDLLQQGHQGTASSKHPIPGTY